MRLGRCPICRSQLDLQAIEVDESGRDLLAMMAKLPSQLAGPLLSYLGLFRPLKQDLTNSRTLKLAEEVLALTSDRYLLGAAMAETVQQIQTNRQAGGDVSPLKNHNYLKKVLKGIGDRIGQAIPAADQKEPKSGQPLRAASDAEWRRGMEKLGINPDELLKKHRAPGGDQ